MAYPPLFRLIFLILEMLGRLGRYCTPRAALRKSAKPCLEDEDFDNQDNCDDLEP